MFVFTPFGDVASGIKRINEGLDIGAIVAHGIEVNGFSGDDVGNDVLPDGPCRVRFEAIHMIPKALRGQRGPRSVWKMPSQGGLGKPVKHSVFAPRMHGAVERCDGNICAHAQALLTFGTVGIDFVDDDTRTSIFDNLVEDLVKLARASDR